MNLLRSLPLVLFTGFGLLIAAVVAIDWLQGVDTYSWEATTCTIESSRVVQRPESADYSFEVSYRYFQRGEEFRSETFQRAYSGSEDIAETERLAERYRAGAEVACWVNPDSPSESCLRRANLWRGLLILLPLLFVAVGAGSLWFLHGRGKAEAPGARGIAPAPSRSAPFKTVGLLVGFFALFFLVGAGMFVPFFILPVLRVAEARSWRAVPCEILASGVRSHSGDDGDTYSVEALYRYQVDGRQHQSNRYQFLGGSSSGYESKAAAVEKIPAGATITCYVNPDDPFDAVIERGLTTDYLFGLVPLLFALIGAGGMALVIVGARAVKTDAARPSWRAGIPVGPTGVPRSAPAGVSRAAGSTGPITLEPAMGPVGKLGCALGIALLWNGVVAPFVWIAVKGFHSGSPDWFLTVVITPFVLIGLLLLSGIPYSILGLLNPRPRLRISRATLRVGESTQIDWSFVGMSGRIRRLKIWLESSRTTTRTVSSDRGTSTQTRVEPLGTLDVLERGSGPGIESGSVTFTVPDGTLPTSDGDEAIGWKLKLQGEIAFWPDVLEEYEIPLLPALSDR
jgi:hypothetical protein